MHLRFRYRNFFYDKMEAFLSLRYATKAVVSKLYRLFGFTDHIRF